MKIELMDSEVVNHLGHLGYSESEMENMTEAEIAEHMYTQDEYERSDSEEAFLREAILNK